MIVIGLWPPIIIYASMMKDTSREEGKGEDTMVGFLGWAGLGEVYNTHLGGPGPGTVWCCLGVVGGDASQPAPWKAAAHKNAALLGKKQHWKKRRR